MATAISAPPPSIWYPKITHFRPGRVRPTIFRVSACATSTLPEDPKEKKLEYTPWLIVGLGNPGTTYHGTRHNVGFEMIEKFAQRQGIQLNTIQSKSLIGIGSVGEVPILVAKPQTYMNHSGEAVGPLAAYYKVPLRHILLIYDEMSLPNGVLRVQPKAGHGHHNGVKSVMGHLDGRKEFPRLCIGIGNPPGTMDMKAFLLQKFSPRERTQVQQIFHNNLRVFRLMITYCSLVLMNAEKNKPLMLSEVLNIFIHRLMQHWNKALKP